MEERSMHRDQCGRSKVTKGTMGVEAIEGRIGGRMCRALSTYSGFGFYSY